MLHDWHKAVLRDTREDLLRQHVLQFGPDLL